MPLPLLHQAFINSTLITADKKTKIISPLINTGDTMILFGQEGIINSESNSRGILLYKYDVTDLTEFEKTLENAISENKIFSYLVVNKEDKITIAKLENEYSYYDKIDDPSKQPFEKIFIPGMVPEKIVYETLNGNEIKFYYSSVIIEHNQDSDIDYFIDFTVRHPFPGLSDIIPQVYYFSIARKRNGANVLCHKGINTYLHQQLIVSKKICENEGISLF